MSYSIDLAAAARRHLEAADVLNNSSPKRRDVAGYLYGIAGECALKRIMWESGMRPGQPERRRDDPFFIHFPDLKTMLKDRIHGRRHGELQRYAGDGALFSNWSTDMRYAPGREIKDSDVERWREQARKLVEGIGL